MEFVNLGLQYRWYSNAYQVTGPVDSVKSFNSVKGKSDAALAPGPQNRLRNGERRPLFPYRGLGDVAALGDILAVLLVGHTDPLLGNHLRGATTCPGHPLGLARSLLLGPLRPTLRSRWPRRQSEGALRRGASSDHWAWARRAPGLNPSGARAD